MRWVFSVWLQMELIRKWNVWPRTSCSLFLHYAFIYVWYSFISSRLSFFHLSHPNIKRFLHCWMSGTFGESRLQWLFPYSSGMHLMAGPNVFRNLAESPSLTKDPTDAVANAINILPPEMSKTSQDGCIKKAVHDSFEQEKLRKLVTSRTDSPPLNLLNISTHASNTLSCRTSLFLLLLLWLYTSQERKISHSVTL